MIFIIIIQCNINKDNNTKNRVLFRRNLPVTRALAEDKTKMASTIRMEATRATVS